MTRTSALRLVPDAPIALIDKESFYQTPNSMVIKAISAKLTASDWCLWAYLQAIDPHGDRMVDIPSPEEIGESIGLSSRQVQRSLAKLEKCDLYAYEIVQLRGQNLAGLRAKQLCRKKRELKICEQSKMTNLSDDDKFVEAKTDLSDEHIYITCAGIQTNPDSSKLNLKTTTNKKIVAVELKKVDSEQDPEGSYQEDKEIFLQLRRAGININPTIKKIIVAHRPNVVGAIAHLKERIFSGERFKSLEGAFVTACQEGAKPERLINPPIELPQPNKSQLQELEIAKRGGKVRSYCSGPYNGGRTLLVDDCVKCCVVTWWEYLKLDCYEEFEEVEF